MKPWMKSALAIVVLLAVAAGLIVVYLEMREERDREAEMEKPVKEPSRVAISADREIVVKLDPAAQARAALKTDPLAEMALAPETAAYGRFEEDPSSGLTLRAPIAGILRAAGGREWPALGENLGADAAFGWIEPRFAATDRVDLASRLAAARAEVDARNVGVRAAKSSLDRVRILNAEEKGASDRTVEEADLRFREEEARLRAASETVKLLEASLAPVPGEAARVPLTGAAGQVVAVLARPGEAVESGQDILRVANVGRLVARAWVPPGEPLVEPSPAARILALGREDRPLRAIPLGRGNGPGTVLMYRVETADPALRPGMAFQAWILSVGDPQKGVVVPRSALVRFAGKTWAYVQLDEPAFARREVVGARPVADGWFVPQGFTPGQRVVTSGAQILLSEELKSQIQVGEEEMRKG
jgi:membrane fusion protein, multidrug efflux system